MMGFLPAPGWLVAFNQLLIALNIIQILGLWFLTFLALLLAFGGGEIDA
jgi:hypothetical protein